MRSKPSYQDLLDLKTELENQIHSLEKKVEQLSSEAEQNSELILNGINDFIIITTVGDKIIWMNDYSVRNIGKSLKKLTGINLTDLITEEERKQTEANIDKLKKGKKKSLSFSLSAEEEEIIPVESYLIKGKKGMKSVYFWIMKDLRSQKKAEEQHLLSEEKFYKAFHSNPALMAISTFHDAKYLDVNESFLNNLGYKREEIIGHSSTELQLYVDIIQSDKFFKKLQKLRKVHDYEVTIKTKTGENRIGLFSAETIMLQGEPCLLTIINDVTQRKEAEKTLYEVETRYRQIFENMRNCVAVYHPVDDGKDFHFVEYNPAAERADKVNRADIIGKSLLKVFPGVEEFGILDALKKVHQTGETQSLPVAFYKDSRISGWRENILYKLPNGDIMAIYEDLSQQKQYEENLKRSEERFREFAELIPAMICEASMDGKLFFANGYAMESFGYSRDEVQKGVNFEDLFIPRDLKRARVNLMRRIKGQKISANEFTAVKKDGSLFPVLTYIHPIIEKGNPVGFRGVLIDITTRKAAEQELEMEKAFLEHLIEGAPEAIAQCDNKGKLVRVNNEFTRLFGYTKRESVGQYADPLLTSADLLQEARSITQRIAKGERVALETVRYHKNGSLINVSILGTPIIINNKQVGLFGIYRDITERKQAEKIQQMIYQITNAVLTSESMDELFQTIKEELSSVLDTKNFFIALYHKETDSLSLPFFRDEKDQFDNIPAGKTLTAYVIKKKKPLLFGIKEMQKLEQAGEIDLVGTPSKVWLGVPLRAEDEIIGVISLQSYDDEKDFNRKDLEILEFISNQAGLSIDRKRAEQNLIIAKQKAEEAALAKQQFLSTMSHEIRTPINAVVGMTHLLLQEEPREDQMDYIHALKFSGDNLLVLINDILDFSKIEYGKVFFEEAIFNLKNLINGIKQSFIYRAEEKGIKLKVLMNPELPEFIIGDSVRLNQVLTNLISNAIKFTEKGSVTIEVTLNKESGKNVEIEFIITDTGIGIPKNKLGYIFESFAQASTDTTRKFGGTGLGLAISKRLIELQDSEIHVESTPGKGSKFFFTLSFPKSDTKPVVARFEIDENFDKLKGKRVLLAEDNEINRIVAEKFLRKWDIIVDHAENGHIALEKLNQNRYDIVLMDLLMPELDGYDTTKIIRNSSDPWIKSVPIIAITASMMMEVQEKIMEIGMDDYIFKPFNPNELFRKIMAHIK